MTTMIGASVDKLREIMSVQGAIALAFSAAFIVGFFRGMVSEDAFLGVSTLVIGFWFNRAKEEPSKKTNGGT